VYATHPGDIFLRPLTLTLVYAKEDSRTGGVGNFQGKQKLLNLNDSEIRVTR
jgi:hypothetical protein